VKHNFD